MYGMFSSGRSAGILPAFLNLRFAADLAFLFVQSEKQNGRREAGATKERRVRGEISVGARHAVPGKGTWQALRHSSRWEIHPPPDALPTCDRVTRDLLVARSGTACRAPTVGNGKREEKNDVVIRAKN
jgi:hypothetical protein